MNAQYVLADRGTAVDIAAATTSARWLIVAHAGSLRSQGAGLSIWIQLRGRSRIVAREGCFDLRRGDWIVLDRDSAPEISAGRHGLTIGLIAVPHVSGSGRRQDLLPGLGHMATADLRIALRLWRNGADAMREHTRMLGERTMRAFHAMAQHIAGMQQEMDQAISRCPGRSVARKRQVFGRLQRARLFLEGHRERVVRLTELADLTSFSSWYLSKTYHEIYLESPQAASVRLRLEHACDLLADSECSISEVGIACGFDNSCSFARAFRTRYGTTATDYRKLHGDNRHGESRRGASRFGDSHLGDGRNGDGRSGDSRQSENRQAHAMTSSRNAVAHGLDHAVRGAIRRATDQAAAQASVGSVGDVAVRAVGPASNRYECEPDADAKIGTCSGLVATRECAADSVMWLPS
jgi:AraC family transcriptional regulator